MKTIAEFDFKNYDPAWKVFSREAVRVIIIKNGKAAMVRSKRGYYKFPGGGKRSYESYVQTAIRETREETGLSLIEDTINEYGAILEIRKSNRHPEETFRQISYYYTADAEETVLEQKLDEYEADEGYSLEWVDIEEACGINSQCSRGRKCAFLSREVFILKKLLGDEK